MTREENIRAILESNFAGYKEEIIDIAVKRICELEQEPKTGHWIPVTNGRGGHECDICHEYAPSYQSGDEYLSKYCPNCGAKMVEPQERSE